MNAPSGAPSADSSDARRPGLLTYLRALGPGIISGAADDDPSGIGTMSQTGAQFGYAQSWTLVLCVPLMIAIQEICARVALETGAGLGENLRRHYSPALVYPCVTLLFAANAVNLGADLGAMAGSAQMLLGLSHYAWLVLLAILIVVLLVVLGYRTYSRLLRAGTLALLAYVVVLFLSRQDWGAALRGTFVPQLHWDRDFLMNVVAMLGTSISPYLFFWQSSEEVEEQQEQGVTTAARRRRAIPRQLKLMRADVVIGMVLSQFVAWSITATAAATLHARGLRDVAGAQEAAEALRPLAGDYAYVLFAAGIIGTGMLAIPVLAGSTAYAVAEMLRLPNGLSKTWRQAKGFYSVITLAVVIGAALNVIGVNPIKALYYSAVANGLAAPPLMVLVMLISGSAATMKQRRNGPSAAVVGWLATGIMTVAAVAMLAQLALGGSN